MPVCLYDEYFPLLGFLLFCFFLYCELVHIFSVCAVVHVWDSGFILLLLNTANIKKVCNAFS